MVVIHSPYRKIANNSNNSTALHCITALYYNHKDHILLQGDCIIGLIFSFTLCEMVLGGLGKVSDGLWMVSNVLGKMSDGLRRF